MSNWHVLFPDAKKTLDEEKVKRGIDALLSYRRKEVLFTLAFVWATFLVLTFSLLLTIRLAFTVPIF